MLSKQLVEEYMLLANIIIAEFLVEHCQDRALLRVHDDLKDKDKLREFFDKVGLDQIDLTNPLTLSKSFDALKEDPESSEKLTVINRKIL